MPDAPNSVLAPVHRPGAVRESASARAVPVTRTDTDSPVASFICEATVRFQTSSYSRNSSPESPVLAGVRKLSPAGLIASCASCALFTLLV